MAQVLILVDRFLAVIGKTFPESFCYEEKSMEYNRNIAGVGFEPTNHPCENKPSPSMMYEAINTYKGGDF